MSYITVIAHPSEARTVEEVENVMKPLEGIQEWSLDNGVITLTYDDEVTSLEALTDAFIPIGYSMKYPV